MKIGDHGLLQNIAESIDHQLVIGLRFFPAFAAADTLHKYGSTFVTAACLKGPPITLILLASFANESTLLN